MEKEYSETISIPEGISCSYENRVIACSKDTVTLKRNINAFGVDIKIEKNSIVIRAERSRKKEIKTVNTIAAHIRNIFRGLNEKFSYTLEVAHVHFPMTLKQQGDKIIISNFLGEKNPRVAKIMPNTEVEIKGQTVTVSSHDKESAGQTAANLEKATYLTKKDRRIFQDGVYITAKPERIYNE